MELVNDLPAVPPPLQAKNIANAAKKVGRPNNKRILGFIEPIRFFEFFILNTSPKVVIIVVAMELALRLYGLLGREDSALLVESMPQAANISSPRDARMVQV